MLTNLFKRNPRDMHHSKDDVYMELLRLAIPSPPEGLHYDLEFAIETLNQIPFYSKIHWRIIPLLKDKAEKLGVLNQLNKGARDILIEKTKEGIIREAAKEKQLKSILDLLTENNIRVILLKGTAFANWLYTKEAPRLSNDIDLLVTGKDYHRAVQLIQTLMVYSKKPVDGLFADLYETSFKPRSSVGAALDLHTALTYPYLFKINESELWQHSISHPNYEDNRVRTLCNEHALIHQALHAYRDMNFTKYNLVDSYLIFSRHTFENVVEQSNKWGTNNILYFLISRLIKHQFLKVGPFLIQPIKPSRIGCNLLEKLMISPSKITDVKMKTVKYRVKQLIGQFAFTGSLSRPLRLQLFYLRMAKRAL